MDAPRAAFADALRFQPSGGFPVASEFRVDLLPERLLKEGQVFSGDTSVLVRTDQFLVEGVDVVEEPALEGKGKVVFRGNIRFNYPVNPEVLAPKIRLEDPRASKPVAVTLETSWQAPVIGFRTEAVQKEKDERTVRLVIAGTALRSAAMRLSGRTSSRRSPLGRARGTVGCRLSPRDEVISNSGAVGLPERRVECADEIRVGPREGEGERAQARRVVRRGGHPNAMKHRTPAEDDDLRPEYDFDFSQGERGRYFKRLLKEGGNIAVLEPDIAKAFLDSTSVNKALRALLEVARAAAGPARRSTRSARVRTTD